MAACNEALRWVEANCGRNAPRLALAGGAAVWLLQKCPREWVYGDLDLFFIAESAPPADQSISWLVADRYRLKPPPGVVIEPPRAFGHLCSNGVTTARRVISYYSSEWKTDIQFIITSYWRSVPALLKGFDLSCCRVAVGSCTNGRPNFIVDKTYSFDAATAYLTPTREPRGASPSTLISRKYWLLQNKRTTERIAKYTARGATITKFVYRHGPHQTFAAKYIDDYEAREKYGIPCASGPFYVDRRPYALMRA